MIDCDKSFKTYQHENTTSKALQRHTWEASLFQLLVSAFTHLPCHIAPKEEKKYCYYCICFAPRWSVVSQTNQIFFFAFPCLLWFSPDKALSNTEAEQGAGFPPAIHWSAPAHPRDHQLDPCSPRPPWNQGQHQVTACPQIKTALVRWARGSTYQMLLGLSEC